MTEKPQYPRKSFSFNFLNGTRFPPVTIIIVLGLVTAMLTAIMFSFHLGIWDLQSEELQAVKKQVTNTEQLLDAMKNTTYHNQIESKQRSLAATAERQFQIELTQQNQNLSKRIVNEMEPLINSSNQLLKGRTTLINEIKDVTHKIDNATQEVLDTLKVRAGEHRQQTELIQKGLVETGNATAQRAAIQDITKILENQNKILELLGNRSSSP